MAVTRLDRRFRRTHLWTALLFSLVMIVATAAVASANDDYRATMVVTGRAEIRAQPDMAVFNIGVETRAETLEEAREANAAAMERVRRRLFAAGADEDALKTRGFNVYPEWHYDNKEGTRTLIGYRVTHTLEVTVLDIDVLGAWLDAAMQEGANQISGPTFGLQNPERLEAQALAEAVRKARAKAEVLARASGTYLKRVLHISENVNTPISVAPRAAFTAMDAVMVESTPTSISPGEVTVSAQVSITYEI